MTNDRPLIGIAYFVVANLLTAAVDAVSKYLTGEMHALQIVWGYFVAIAVCVICYGVAARLPPRLFYGTRRLPLQVLRAALLLFTIGTLFAGLKYIPLADATAITFSAPLIIAALSAPILGERVGGHRWGAVLVGMLGVLIVIRPVGDVVHWAVLLPLAAAFGFATFQIVTRLLADTEATFVTLFYTSASGAAMSSILVVFVWAPLDLRQAAILFGIGALGAGAHLCFFRAFMWAQASFLAPFNYVKLIWVTIFGYMLFADIPAPHVILGSTVIILSGLYVLMRERRPRNRI
jgi:drug/metabolite transporter (DMT)-like permease